MCKILSLCHILDLCVTEEGRQYAAQQSTILLQALQYLLDKNHPNKDIIDSLLQIKNEMLDFDHNATTQWRFYFSLYNVLIHQDKSRKSPLPFMQVLYEIPPDK